MLPHARPGMIGKARSVLEKSVEAGEGLRLETGDFGDPRRRIRLGLGPEQRQDRRAIETCAVLLEFDFSFEENIIWPTERQARVVGPRSPVAGQHHVGILRLIRPDLARPQEAPCRPVDQHGRICPGADKGAVVAVSRKQVPDGSHGECAVGAGPDRQPQISTLARTAALRVDHDDSRAATPCVGDPRRLRKPGAGGIVPPQYDLIGTSIIRRSDPASKCKGVGVVLVPAADLHAVDEVGASETSHETLDPLEAVDHGRAARRRNREGDRLRSVIGPNLAESPGDLLQRLVPANLEPARIGITPRSRASEGTCQPARAPNHFGCGTALRAKRGAGWMAWVGCDGDQSAVGDVIQRTASRPAKRTITRFDLHHGSNPGSVRPHPYNA